MSNIAAAETKPSAESTCEKAGADSELALLWVFPNTRLPMVDLARPRDLLRAPAASRARAEPPKRPNAATETVMVGREPHAKFDSVVLDDGEVSRQHAVLRRRGTDSAIEDIGSRNGVYVNGVRLQPNRATPLEAGDVVRIGGHIGVLTASPGVHDEIAPGLWGGARMRSAFEPALAAKKGSHPIVVEGETGTGKEVVAHAIHRLSRANGPFVSINCASINKNSPESELFGYADGTFTDNRKGGTKGRFRRAHGGTLFLDEVCELPLPVQATLLRVLEERLVQPLGDAEPIAVDVRVIVAAQRPLEEEVRSGRFREDLFARLEGTAVRLPPLRQRREDIAPLFVRTLRDLSEQATAPKIRAPLIERLCLHDWPRNVRQLETVARALWQRHGSEPSLKLRHLEQLLPPAAAAPEPAEPPSARAAFPKKIEAEVLIRALRDANGILNRAARNLGVDRSKFRRETQRYPDVDWSVVGKNGDSS
jgi:transcriptional regulator with AAA-type ATPase domain